MINSVVLVGRLTADVELKEVGEGKVVNFSVAVPRSYKKEDGTQDVDFISCSIWGGQAENMKEYCKKGDLVGIRGELMTSTYEKEGQKHYKTEVRVNKMSYLQSKKVEVEE